MGEMKTYTAAELRDILALHLKWRNGEEGGIRADLGGANLGGANLRGANLGGADLGGADLGGAYLGGADLGGAYLGRANLGRANLRGANLGGANLGGAYLRGAYLGGADLRGANLRGANLGGANLGRAYLGGANLGGAYLGGANLGRANLGRAYLGGADLGGANLSGAYLRDANLQPIRDDVHAVLSAAPNEVPGLLLALREGRIDGSAYQGECACLVGTIANVRGCDVDELGALKPDSRRPAERWFLLINQGDKPDTTEAAKITEGWIVEWQAANPPQAVTP